MIGIQSSIIMFPINLLIVSIFRNTRPREKTNKTDATKQGKTVRVAPSQTSSPQKELKDITPDTVIKVRSNASFLILEVTTFQFSVSEEHDVVFTLGHKENCSVALKGHEESTATPGAPRSACGHQHSAFSGGGHH